MIPREYRYPFEVFKRNFPQYNGDESIFNKCFVTKKTGQITMSLYIWTDVCSGLTKKYLPQKHNNKNELG